MLIFLAIDIALSITKESVCRMYSSLRQSECFLIMTLDPWWQGDRSHTELLKWAINCTYHDQPDIKMCATSIQWNL